MSAAQCKAARRKMRHDPRYKPKRGSRSLARANAIKRKVANAGGGARSVGFQKRK
jgi:hypothetical protein